MLGQLSVSSRIIGNQRRKKKMMKQIFFFAVAICLIQTITCNDFEDIVAELAPKIEGTINKVINVTRLGGYRVRDSFLRIEEALNILEHELDGKKNQLDDTVNQTVSDAQKSGKNVSACVEAVREDFRYVSKFQFHPCRVSKELNSLAVHVDTVGVSEEDVVGGPFKCAVKAKDDTEQFTQCILDVLDDVEKQAVALDKEVAEVIPRAEEEAHKCGKDNASRISEEIAKVEKDFLECAEKA